MFFIDLEYTHVNYGLWNIANDFVQYAGGADTDFTLFPSGDEQKQWLTNYYDDRGFETKIINDDLCISSSDVETSGFGPISSLSQSDFDYIHYARKRADCYQKLE